MLARYIIDRMFERLSPAPVKEPTEKPGTKPATPTEPSTPERTKPAKPWRGPRVDPSVKPRPKAWKND